MTHIAGPGGGGTASIDNRLYWVQDESFFRSRKGSDFGVLMFGHIKAATWERVHFGFNFQSV